MKEMRDGVLIYDGDPDFSSMFPENDMSLTRLTPIVPKGPLKSGVKGIPILIQLLIKAPLSFET